MRPLFSLSTLAAAALVAACSTAAVEPAAAPALPAQFAQAQGAERGDRVQPDWWRVFDDPALDALVERGLATNLDLQQAAQRVQRSRALAAGAHAERAPRGGVALGARAQQASRSEAPGADADARRSDSVSLGASVGWELDLFGRLGKTARAADARADAAAHDADAMRLAVGAEIAQVWFALDGTRDQWRIARGVVENRRATLELVRKRVAAGFHAPLDEERAQAELAAAVAELPALEAAQAVAAHRLAVLLGESPSGFEPPQAAAGATRPVSLRLPEPAQWAAQRPDLQAAEARLRAQALDVEAVRAEFLPRVSIAGVLGFVAGSMSGLGAAGSASWFVAPSVSVPLFDAARIDARLQAARAGQREALLAYRQRVLLAIEEVESALVEVGQGHARLAALHDRARHAVVAESIARRRFQAGASDLLELLDAQRGAQQAELGLAAALTTQRQHTVALQRALGARFLPAQASMGTQHLADVGAAGA
jgi:NodT family efflux transporter outer membrane factor (OMF) lipoprotein